MSARIRNACPKLRARMLCKYPCVLCIYAYAYMRIVYDYMRIVYAYKRIAYAYMRIAYTCVCLHAVAHSPYIKLCVLGKGSLQVHECRYANTHTHTHARTHTHTHIAPLLSCIYIYKDQPADYRGGATQQKDTT